MTTTPPKKSTASRRKRPVVDSAESEMAVAASVATESTSGPEAGDSSPAPLDDVVESAAAPASPVAEAVVEAANTETGTETSTTEASAAETDFDSLPPLVGEFISRKDWAETSDFVPPRGGVGRGKNAEDVINRVRNLDRSMGWILISAGLVGIIVPGMIGTPFVLLGGLVLWPSCNQKVLEKWRKDSSSTLINGAMKQVDRFLDDLEGRYPSSGDKH